MAGRIRSIKPEILEDERSAGLSSDAWRLWVSMWLLADDHGRLRGTPSWLHSQVFWACPHTASVPDLLSELNAAGLIIRYEVSGQKYIEIPGWNKHQRVDHPGKPRVPAPSDADSRDCRYSLATDLRPPTTTPISDLLKLTSPPAPVIPFLDFALVYARYPRKEGKTKGIDRLRSQVRSLEAFEELLTAVTHFAEKHAVEGTERRFIPHFSTWCSGGWRDFIDGPHVDEAIVAKGVIAKNRAADKTNYREPAPHVAETKDETDAM